MTTSAVPAANAVSPSELQHLIALQPQLRILDVRTPGEFQGSHIPGSFNVTCAMGTMLAKLPYNSGPSCDIDQVLIDFRNGFAR